MSVNVMSQRALQTSLRRFALQPKIRTLSPVAVALGQVRYTNSAFLRALEADVTRYAATQSVSGQEGLKLLAEQRRQRPVSPHLSIYRPQITWYASALNRITGSILSGGLYVFGAAYLAAPLFGWHLESASMAAAFAAWPVIAKVATKFLIAWPFTFHSFNGLRHLLWDTGSAMTNKQVIVTGWVVVGISAVTALGLTFY